MQAHKHKWETQIAPDEEGKTVDMCAVEGCEATRRFKKSNR